jgi:hypothetical protein
VWHRPALRRTGDKSCEWATSSPPAFAHGSSMSLGRRGAPGYSVHSGGRIESRDNKLTAFCQAIPAN